MITVFLLFCSNVLMTFAWYGHLKYGEGWPLWRVILASWSSFYAKSYLG
ncbi:MAG: DMT family protein [Deltaproteobacteria bacterium]|nr:DMT family protein [Deltaproteobacteria bacterium]